jgi:hypothetical protein
MSQLHDPALVSIVPLFFSENKVVLRSCKRVYERTGMTAAETLRESLTVFLQSCCVACGGRSDDRGGIPLCLSLTTRQNLIPTSQKTHWRSISSDSASEGAFFQNERASRSAEHHSLRVRHRVASFVVSFLESMCFKREKCAPFA